MSSVNAVLRLVFELALSPFRGLPPIVGLVIVSLLTAVAMLLIFKRTSNQEGIASVKRRIHAGLFEIRLFNDDLGAILRAQMDILRHNLTYLRLSAVPMLWTLPPLVLIIAQLQFHYGYQGLEVGKPTLVKVELQTAEDDASWQDAPRPSLSLQAPAGIEVETPGVWIPSIPEMDWRIRPESPGEYTVDVVLDGQPYSKSVTVSDDVVLRSPSRLARGFWNQLLYPAEEALPSESPIRSVTVRYPDASVSVFGWPLHWMIVYFVLAIVFAFALRNVFKVQM
ncbi:MAG: hypothetical protein ACRD1X_06455 [Vicinamibacteria bacterium]